MPTPRTATRRSTKPPELDHLLERIRGLIRQRNELQATGAHEETIGEHGNEIEKLQLRLASVVKKDLTPDEAL